MPDCKLLHFALTFYSCSTTFKLQRSSSLINTKLLQLWQAVRQHALPGMCSVRMHCGGIPRESSQLESLPAR